MQHAHPGLENPEYYVPGLPVDYVASRYGIPQSEIAKLGSAENPHGTSPLAKAAVEACLNDLHLYPSWTADPLREKIASTYGFQAEEVICGAGETEILSLITRAFCPPGDKIQMPGVGVSSYENLKRNVNKKVQDLLKRSKKGNHTGMGERQFKLLGVMWKALADYEEKQ